MNNLAAKVDFTIFIRTTPERCYDALATANGLDSWFTHGTLLDPAPGGEILFRWKDWGYEAYTGEIPGAVIAYERPGKFAFRWRADSGGYDSVAEVTFEPVPAGTLVRMVEQGYEDSPAGLQDLVNRASGWAQALTLMRFYLEHGVRY